MKIYIAARYARAEEMRGIADQLTADGHQIISTWIDGEHNEGPEAAAIDLAEIRYSDVVLCFTDPCGSKNSGGGRWFECGYALAIGKRVIFIGDREIVFCHLPEVEVYPSLARARLALCLLYTSPSPRDS